MNEHLNIEEFYRGLDALFAEKQTGEVTGYLKDWLQKAENAGDIPAIIAVSNELGGICRVTGKIDRAKELYATVLTLLEESGMADTENYATALINTGDVYIFNREQEKALTLIERDFGRMPLYDEVAAGLAEVKGKRI